LKEYKIGETVELNQ